MQLLVAEAAKAFLEDAEARTTLDGTGRRRRSPQTLVPYRTHLGRWLDEPFYLNGVKTTLGAMAVVDVDSTALRSLLAVVRDTPTRYGTPPAPNTVRNVANTFGALFTWAELHYGLQGFVQPTRGLELGRRVMETAIRPVKKTVYLDGAGADRIAEAASPIYRPLIEFINSTGARIGEARGVRWCDLHLDEAVPFVRFTVQVDFGGKPMANLKHRAPGEYRDVPLPIEQARKLLARKVSVLESGGDPTGEALVFPTRTGRATAGSNLSRALERICDQLGIERVTPHTLRDAYAWRLLAAGTDIATLSGLLGHKDVSTTVDAYLDANVPIDVQAAAIARAFG